MDHYQRNVDDDYSTITFHQPLNSTSFISSVTSMVDSTSKQSKVNGDRLKNRTRSFRKHPIPTISPTRALEKQEARPLGTCVRKCIQCRQLKHILLAECTVCFRMMDVDLKDCKCQILKSKNSIEHFICSMCNSQLTLDGYIICANRTCQTTLSGLIHNESTGEMEEKSLLTLTDLCYPKSTCRTVAVQVNTLNNLPPLQRFAATIVDDKSKEMSSSSSWSKGDSNRTTIISSDSSGTSRLSMDSAVDGSSNEIARNLSVGFNSNQPSKLALQSEDESQQSPTNNRTNTTDITVNNTPEYTEVPKSPRCLAIMNARKRRNRLSALLTLSVNKTCQTQLFCLAEIDKMVDEKELSDVTLVRTTNPNRMERQIQVDTIKGRFNELCQVRIEIADRMENDSTSSIINDERVVRALTDRDGPRWSEFVDQLINEQPNILPSDKAQQLLDTFERLHSNGRLNSLTTGQLQRKIRYAMSQLKHFDERLYLQNHPKPTKDTRSRSTPKRTSECNGRIDMAVTVRQIDKPHPRQTDASSDQNWKPYVDRLFEQGLSANEIQRLLHEAAKTTLQSDDQRLQDVFDYTNKKANQQRAKTAPSRITSVENTKGTESITRHQFQTKNVFHSARLNETTKSSGGIMARSSPSVSERKGKSNESSPNLNNLSKSTMIQPQPLEKMSIIDFNEDEIEPNVSVHSSSGEEHKNTVANLNVPIIDEKESINDTEITIKRETSRKKKSTSDGVNVNLAQKTNETPKISSTMGITPLTSPDNIPNTNVRSNSRPSNTPSELRKLITDFESHLYQSDNIDRDNIESLMIQCVDYLNNEKETVKSPLEESETRNLAEKISSTLNLLQEYQRIITPIKANEEDSPFNQHTSNMVPVSVDDSVSSHQVKENMGQIIESESSSKSNLDLKQQINTSDYEDTVNPIRCRPIPYTNSNEKGSAATSEQLLVCPTEHIPLKYQDPNKQLISSESNVKNALDKPTKTESDSYSNRSQMAWLHSLLSKMSSNVSSTTDIVSASPSLSATNPTKVELSEQQQQEEEKEKVDAQIPPFNHRPRSSISNGQYTKNTPTTTDDGQSTLYGMDVIKLEEKHATSIIVPDQDIAILEEQFQVIQTKISQLLNSEDQTAPIQNKVSPDISQKEPSNLDDGSNETPSHENNVDPKQQSTSSDGNDHPQSMITPSACDSNDDLLEQFDQLQMHEETTPSERVVLSTSEDNLELSQKQLNDENTSSELTPEYMELSKTDSNVDPVTSTKSSSSNDQGNKATSVLSFPSDESKHQNSIEKTTDSSQNEIQPVDKYVSKATSQIMSRQNDMNKLRLPTSAQHLSTSNSIKSTSLLTDFHDQDDTDQSKESIASDNPSLDLQEHSSVKISSSNSDNQNTAGTSTQNDNDRQSSDEKIDDIVNTFLHAPVMLPPNFSFAQQAANVMLSPLRTTKIEEHKFKKSTTPPFFSLTSTPPPATTLSEEKELESKCDSIPRLFIQEPSGSLTPSVHAVTTDDVHDEKKPDPSTSGARKAPNDSRPKDDLENKFVSKQESSSFDANIRTPPSPSRTTETLDEQQPKTVSTINKKYSRPKILAEDIQTPPVLTPHSSALSVTPDDDTQKKFKQKPEDDAKSSSKPITPNSALENTATSEHSITKDDKSEENASVHSSIRSEQRSIALNNTPPLIISSFTQHEDDDPSKKNHSLRIESLIKLLPSPPDKQSMDDMHSETEDALDQNLPLYLIDNEGRLINEKPSHPEQHLSPMTLHSIMNRGKWPSSVVTKRSPMISPSPVVLPSPAVNIKIQERKLKSQLTPLENKNDESTSDLISVSSFNLAHLTDLTPNNHHQTGEKYSPSQSEKSLPDTIPHPLKSKQPSSSTNSLGRTGIPSSSIPKLLLKRFSHKQPSAIVSSMKPNTALSITDVSVSSSNTIATDHLLTTHSTMSDHEEIIPLKKTNRKSISKNGFTATSESISKRNILRKTSRPSENQLFVSENRKERHTKPSTKKLTDDNVITNLELIDDTEPWIQSHDDINPIFKMNEQDEEKPQVYKPQRIKQNKNRIANRSRRSPSKSKVQTNTLDSSRLPNIEQAYGEHHLKKFSNDPFRRPIIRLPVTQIEKFECGTIGPHLHPSSVAHQILSLPSICERPQFPAEINEVKESFTDRLYSLMSPENDTDEQAFESILHRQDHQHLPKIEPNKYQYMYVLDTSTGNSVRGKQYPILTDEIDMIDDPYACTIVNEWAFADLVNDEREKCIQRSMDTINKPKKKSNANKRIQIYLRKRPLTSFEETILKEVDIISITDPQTLLLHIPSITVDNQVFIKNRKFKCDQTFDERCSMDMIYHSTLAPLLDTTIEGNKCLCLIGGGKYSGKTYLLRSLIDLFASDLHRLLFTHDIYIKLLGICHNRIVDILENYSPIRLMKMKNWTLIPNVEFHVENEDDVNYITGQIKKRRRFMHQLIEIHFREKNQAKTVGSLMIVVLASSQYVYTRNLCSHRRKFLINSLNKTILSFKRALLGIRQNPDRIRAAFNNDILTRLIQPYVFHGQSNICYIGTLNPGHRHRIATKSTLEFARNLRFCLKHLNKKRRQRKQE